ncbi:TMEM175 family protein [Daejeonella sp.]|uniref:TMEM175 family protein n=1 Tax=Daejeonella sp. TaxID=2805397 RepID=UPI0026D11968|nr:TMEM175 family protein [Daejeonella sp.]HQT23589.1 TMEM175 family protein [Daejeonella sp.]HQT56882.1 TMEM175 family protein [Daejeonella sp.]
MITKGRLEAFSDGVIAIIITIMVLELKVPHSENIEALVGLFPVFISYVLSFIYVGIYWNNHHHMIHTIKSVNGAILWANLHLLFWLSLIPFVTAWMGENHFGKWPVILYGIILIMNAIAYFILAKTLVSHHGKDSLIAKALGQDWKGKLSLIIYATAIGASFIHSGIGMFLYLVVAVIWLIPDTRIEKLLISESQKEDKHT